ncbi:hypothetical protein HYH03_005513 [Edaphochlamys debaryana]|uniref:Uncharacterized protein n=1 Tax=Edaphochlamys debaryana TaxID=47281 RepID=A0A835YCD5_9CHLO|nr:hypothetical protein HYH03_005513 [Edaphochlamys debaryana]|eukprot:KAG2496280.1 hypothetical protein HYH03_005513 [Edaphochlamys debaryana]
MWPVTTRAGCLVPGRTSGPLLATAGPAQRSTPPPRPLAFGPAAQAPQGASQHPPLWRGSGHGETSSRRPGPNSASGRGRGVAAGPPSGRGGGGGPARRPTAKAVAEDDDEDEEAGGRGALGGRLAEELRELERLYGGTDRTDSSYRTRQNRLDRQNAARAALYGSRHRDADVRLLALRRQLAEEGALRRRGGFAPDDAMPRPSTWHKLPPATQERILEERCTALQEAAGLAAASARRLYVAAPGLLCDITFGVAARLRSLARALGGTAEEAAAAVAARPLLAKLRPDQLEACAAEVAVWLGGGSSLALALRQLLTEPSVAAEGHAPLNARCQALCGCLGLSRRGALGLLLRQPRLMAVEPGQLPARAAAAKALTELAAGGDAGGAQREGAAAASAEDAPPFNPSLLLCTEQQLQDCQRRLQRHLGLDPAAAARLLCAQPALALQGPAALRAAADFIATRLPPPQPPAPNQNPAEALMTQTPAGGAAASQAAGPAERPQPAAASQPLERHQPIPGLQQPQQPQQEEQQEQGSMRQPPAHLWQVVSDCPDTLLLSPWLAGTALEVLAATLLRAFAAEESHSANVVASERAAGQNSSRTDADSSRGAARVSNVMAARRLATQVAAAAPQLLLCQLTPPPGVLVRQAADRPGQRRPSVLAWVKIVEEAHRKRRLDASSVASDGPWWPGPVVAASWAGGGTIFVGDEAITTGGGGSSRPAVHVSSGGINTEALVAAAAAAGAATVPLDLGVQEAELLRWLGAAMPSPDIKKGRGKASGGGGGRSKGGRKAGDGVSTGDLAAAATATAALPSTAAAWLWLEVVPTAPRLLLAPPPQIAAAAAELCGWFAVPAEALPHVLIPPCPLPSPLPPTTAKRPPPAPPAAPTAAAAAAIRLPRQHAKLLAEAPEHLRAAGYRLWAWLGGAATAAATDIAAVLRHHPGLLYDSTTSATCGRVLYELVGPGNVGGVGGDSGAGVPQGEGGAAAWVDGPPQTEAPEVAMPAIAAALLLCHPETVLCDAVLGMLGPAPAPPAGDGGGSGPGASRLGAAVGRLAAVLQVGRPAAAALVLATRGVAAEAAEALTAEGEAAALEAVSLVRRGTFWGRELQRYLYGSTAPAGADGGWESIDAVAGSCVPLMALVTEGRRVIRLRALSDAGLQDAASFAEVLRMPSAEWRQLAKSLGLRRGGVGLDG